MARRKSGKSLGTKGNSEIYTMTWKQLLGSAAFVKGFNEIRKGKPFNYDLTHNAWSYERGRLFGAVYTGKIKDGNRVLKTAIYAAAEAFQTKTIL